LATSTSLPPARTFSYIRVASPRLTKRAIIATLKPCAQSNGCVASSRPVRLSPRVDGSRRRNQRGTDDLRAAPFLPNGFHRKVA